MDNLNNSATVSTNQGQALNVSYASFFIRALAYIIDTSILGLFYSLFLFVFKDSLGLGAFSSYGARRAPFMLQPTIFSFNFFINYAYYVYFLVNNDGMTIGKKLMGIKVVTEDGQKLTYNTAFLRVFGYLLSGLVFGLGFLWALWDSKKQTWHDKLARTVVIKTESSPKILLGFFILFIIFTLNSILFALSVSPLLLKIFSGNVPYNEYNIQKEIERINDVNRPVRLQKPSFK